MTESYSVFIKNLRDRVCEANLLLYRSGLVVSTFGNVSEKDTYENEVIIGIKPSGIAYDKMTPEKICLLSLSGELFNSNLKPSSDTATHLYLYLMIESINGICHSHSTYATAWSQAGLAVPCLGTTHADYVKSHIPCTKDISETLVNELYEENTGAVIVDSLTMENMLDQTMILVKNHGPFTFGKSAQDSVNNSILLEEICKIAYITKILNPDSSKISQKLHQKHYLRKNGHKKYYGQ
jgi:L-ribulose-5-phosphate 4-epimerase